MTTSRPSPKFTGVDTYRDAQGRYSMRYPSDWHQFDIDFGRDGRLFSPSATNTNTYVAIWIEQLQFSAEANDASDLADAFEKGLMQLPACTILERADTVIGNLLKFERFYTFDDNGVTRKRKVWAMYVDKWLMVLTYQGETVEEWEHWYGMANQSFFHFVIPTELWFATDRDINSAGIPVPVKTPRGKAKK